MAKEGFIIPVLVIVVATLIIVVFTGVFSSPKIIRVVDTNGIFCPKTLYVDYSDKIADFEVKLSNEGEGGGIFVSIISNGSLVRATPQDSFNSSAERGWFVDSEEPRDFDFEILKTEKSNFSIDGNYKCEKFFCTRTYFCCNYGPSGNERDYNLINEVC